MTVNFRDTLGDSWCPAAVNPFLRNQQRSQAPAWHCGAREEALLSKIIQDQGAFRKGSTHAPSGGDKPAQRQLSARELAHHSVGAQQHTLPFF